MQLGTEDKKVSVHRLVIVFLIAFIAICTCLVILHLNEQKKSADEMNPIQTHSTEENKIPSAPGTLSEVQIQQIKMDIVTGKREDVPAEVGIDKNFIISEYLYNCYSKENVKDRVACYEVFYFSNNASLKEQKSDCEKLSSQESTACLDNFYYSLANNYEIVFCDVIKDDALMNKCIDTAS